MIYFIVMSCLGLAMSFGARYLAQNVARSEPKLLAIEPKIPRLIFVAVAAGAVVCLAGIIGAILTA